MNEIMNSLLAGVISGSVISAILGLIFHRRSVKTEEEIKAYFQRDADVSRLILEHKEKVVSELLGPMYMHLERTRRAILRWKKKNLYLEAKVVYLTNTALRDLLIQKGHLIPPELLPDAGKLIEHYDYWIEEFESKRMAANPDLDTTFIFVGAKGYPFPSESAERFREAFLSWRSELYNVAQRQIT